MNKENTPILTPLVVYVLWHPACEAGPTLGRRIYQWLRVGYRDRLGSGWGIPVYYRSLPETTPADPGATHGSMFRDAPAGVPRPREIPTDHAVVNVIVPLVDEHAVADATWRAWLEDWGDRAIAAENRKAVLDGAPGGLVVLPVELHSSLARLPRLSSLNALRVLLADDKVLNPEARVDRMAERLCRHLTQAILHQLLLRPAKGLRGKSLGRAVFLSHAKADRETGVGIAEQIRVAALGLGQVDTFYDAGSLQPGEGWEAPMLGAAGGDTAAFVAILSDAYASRYWCREEARLARTPRPAVAQDGDDVGRKIWWVQPAVAAASLTGAWTRLVPELSGVPTLGWVDERSAAAVIDRALLESLLTEVNLRAARGLAERLARPGSDVHYLTWSPDAYTLGEWQRASAAPDGTVVAYPPHGLSVVEEVGLRAANSKGRTRLVTFQDLELGADALPGPRTVDTRRWLVIAGGDPAAADLLRMGVGSEHVAEAFNRVARDALRVGLGVAWGGGKAPREGTGLLAELVDGALSARGAQVHRVRARRSSRSGSPGPVPPAALRNYLGWFPEGSLSTEDEAGLVGLVEVRRLEVADAEEIPTDAEGVARLRADGLSWMRQRMARECHGILSMGGKRIGYSGWLPGTLEEVAAMQASNRPIWIFSGFGGAARELAEWVQSDAPQSILDPERELSHPGNAPLRLAYEGLIRRLGRPDARRALFKKYEDVDRQLQTLRARVRAGGYAHMEAEDYRFALRTESTRELRRLMLFTVAKLAQAPAEPSTDP